MILTLALIGSFCNSWPEIKIHHNNTLLYDGFIEGDTLLEFVVQGDEQNTLRITLCNKNTTKDTTMTHGVITEDKQVIVDDIRFNGVSIDHLFSNTVFTDTTGVVSATYKHISFNGDYTLDFETPVYDWLILNKFKTPVKDDISYFSDYSKVYHYDKELELIEDIYEIINTEFTDHRDT